MRRAKLGVAVILSTGLFAACSDPSPPAGTVQPALVDAAPTSTTQETTTTTEVPPTTTTTAYDWGPVICPSELHPDHHEPCVGTRARSADEPPYEAPSPQSRTVGQGGGNTSGVDIDCESGSNYAINTGNGYYGAYQWLPSTFDAATTAAGNGEWAGTRPDLVPPAVQDEAAAAWVAAGHRDAWPNC